MMYRSTRAPRVFTAREATSSRVWMERIGWWTTRRRPIDRAWKDSVPWFLSRSCLDTYELLNKWPPKRNLRQLFFPLLFDFFLQLRAESIHRREAVSPGIGAAGI
jgi:hypothetical protein